MNGKHVRHKLAGLTGAGESNHWHQSLVSNGCVNVGESARRLTTASTAGELSPTTSRDGHLDKGNTFNYKSALVKYYIKYNIVI